MIWKLMGVGLYLAGIGWLCTIMLEGSGVAKAAGLAITGLGFIVTERTS